MWKHNEEKVREVTQTGNEKSNDADDYLRELLLEFFIGVVDTELFKTVLLKSFKPGKKKKRSHKVGVRAIEKGKPKCPVQHVHATALNYMYPAS